MPPRESVVAALGLARVTGTCITSKLQQPLTLRNNQICLIPYSHSSSSLIYLKISSNNHNIRNKKKYRLHPQLAPAT